MKSRLNSEQASQIEMRLSRLAENNSRLRQFAEGRFARLGATTALGEDAVQRAFQSVLQGLESLDEGRRPSPKDVATSENFEKYMYSVIASVCDAMSRQREFRCIHVPIREEREDNLGEHERGVAIASPENVRSEAQMADLKQTLFPLLRAQAHWTLRPTIDAWEEVFCESDRIPAAGHRKYVGQVRQLAQKIVNDLGGLS
jgi:hypothetical protein